jgi:hypothetical protein
MVHYANLLDDLAEVCAQRIFCSYYLFISCLSIQYASASLRLRFQNCAQGGQFSRRILPHLCDLVRRRDRRDACSRSPPRIVIWVGVPESDPIWEFILSQPVSTFDPEDEIGKGSSDDRRGKKKSPVHLIQFLPEGPTVRTRVDCVPWKPKDAMTEKPFLRSALQSFPSLGSCLGVTKSRSVDAGPETLD